MAGAWSTVNTDPVVWQSYEGTQSIQGINNVNVKFDWRIARNGTMDVRYVFTFVGITPTGITLYFDLPETMITNGLGPLTQRGVYGSCVGSGGTALQFYVARLNLSDIVVFIASNDSRQFEGSFFTTVVET